MSEAAARVPACSAPLRVARRDSAARQFSYTTKRSITAAPLLIVEHATRRHEVAPASQRAEDIARRGNASCAATWSRRRARNSGASISRQAVASHHGKTRRIAICVACRQREILHDSLAGRHRPRAARQPQSKREPSVRVSPQPAQKGGACVVAITNIGAEWRDASRSRRATNDEAPPPPNKSVAIPAESVVSAVGKYARRRSRAASPQESPPNGHQKISHY